ncbi:hypothetical protein CC80DRAFT_589024 [Byssothecium circinans]|uniref:Uncharacterized protein n=1 Tax=Byssothecium circinans TaxID=147558 RepID=A0A6A5UC88_9PLEO|nr:hypothetical protein CC80DRAFT_589024 [Byssothecium circinans]
MHTIRRTRPSALKSHTRNAIRAPLTPRRPFSHTPTPNRGALPNFLPPSTPELTTLLTTLNAKVLLPQHLTKEQRALVYRQENRLKLESEPIEITLGDVSLPLQHLDRNRDMPGRSRTLRDIVHRSETREDWENVVRMMEGLNSAGIRVKGVWLEMIVRKLGEAGMQHLVLKALQRAGATGLRLREWGVVVEVLRAVRDKAAKADWEKEELGKALRLAEQVVELMEEGEHLGKVQGEGDWRGHPAVVALPLEMAAELAYRYEVEGVEGKVRRYAVRLMNALRQRGYLGDGAENDITLLRTKTTARPTDFPNFPSQQKALTSLARQMYTLIPIWNSLSTTRTVLDDTMPMPEEAEKVQKVIWAALQDGLQTLDILLVREGKQIADPEKGYVAYVKDAIARCQDDGEGEEGEGV